MTEGILTPMQDPASGQAEETAGTRVPILVLTDGGHTEVTGLRGEEPADGCQCPLAITRAASSVAG